MSRPGVEWILARLYWLSLVYMIKEVRKNSVMSNLYFFQRKVDIFTAVQLDFSGLECYIPLAFLLVMPDFFSSNFRY